VTLIGATTENPSFEVNAALLSRCALYELRALEPPDVRVVLERALAELEEATADPTRSTSSRRARAGTPGPRSARWSSRLRKAT
jgi:putative ATPase